MKKLLWAAILGLPVLSFAQTPGQTYIIETTTPGLNLADYAANGMSVSTARVDSALFPELTAARTQSAYCTLAVLNKTPKFTPASLPGPGLYKIEYCYPNVSSINAPGVTWTVESAPGDSATGTIDQMVATANTWVQIGGPGATFALNSADNSFLQFDTSTANGGVAASGQRFYIDAVKFTYMAAIPPLTVEVDGVGTNPGTYANLSDAVAFTETQPVISSPHEIRITADSISDDSQILITKPTTIIGDADEDDIPCDILVDVAAFVAQANKGSDTFEHFLELECEGNVTVSDLRIHNTARGNTGSVLGSPIGTSKPAAGVGNYVFNNVWASGSDASNVFLDIRTETALYYTPSSSTSKIWYGYSASKDRGIWNITNNGGAGIANVTLNNCSGGMARSCAVVISNGGGGSTTISGGFFGQVGEHGMRIMSTATDVALIGAEDNRIRFISSSETGNANNYAIAVDEGSDVLAITEVDIRGVRNATTGFGLSLAESVPLVKKIRISGTAGHGIRITGADTNLAIEDVTVHMDAVGGTRNPLNVDVPHTGDVSITNSIFSSSTDATGILNFAGTGSYSISNSALPTDTVAGENLNPTPTSGTVMLNNVVAASPVYSTATYDYTAANANLNWLRPTNGSDYAGAAVGGANLVGGAPGTSVFATSYIVEVNGLADVAGVSYEKLSGAVAYINSLALNADDYAAIHFTTNATPADASQIIISNPVTILGDMDDDGNSADIPVDGVTIQTQADIGTTATGTARRNYIEVSTSGTVSIQDLNIHTNGGTNVSGIGLYNPPTGFGDYALTNVKLSGSDGSGNYLPIDTLNDQLTAAGTRVWGQHSTGRGVITVENGPGAGTFDTTVTNCHAGVSPGGSAVGIYTTNGKTVFVGGAYAHVGGEACFWIPGTGVTLSGSETNRLRAFRPTGAECIWVSGTGVVDLMEYVDSGYTDPAFNSSAFGSTGQIVMMRYCRGYVDSTGGGAVLYLGGSKAQTITKSTFHTEADGLAVSIINSNTGSVSVTDCILTSQDGLGSIHVGGDTGPYTFTNCALPTDGVATESLDPAAPVAYQDAVAQAATTITNSVTSSPIYQVPALTGGLPNYDYADGADNTNFLRPSNSAAYTAAASDNGNLTGGAGGTAVPVTLSRFSIE